MAVSSHTENAGPSQVVAWRHTAISPAAPRARVTLTPTADGIEARVQAVRTCSSELLRRTPRAEVSESSPRAGALVTVGLAAGTGIWLATRHDDRDVSLGLGAAFLVPAALATGLMIAASGTERRPVSPTDEVVSGPPMPCDVQPWPGALVSVRTPSGTVEGSTDVRGTVRLQTRGPIRFIFVNGTPVADQP